jgi:hypothetical protein
MQLLSATSKTSQMPPITETGVCCRGTITQLNCFGLAVTVTVVSAKKRQLQIYLKRSTKKWRGTFSLMNFRNRQIE